MARNTSNEKWVPPNSLENEVKCDHNDDDGEEEEALSLCDLPITKEKQPESKPTQPEEDDFNFSSLMGNSGSVLAESEMCVADEVFFQGQILPFRNSVSSEPGLSASGYRNPSRSVSRSESMDHYLLSGGFNSFSSRSSSVKSYHSSSSGSTSTINTNTNATKFNSYKKPPKPRNQFHSHPSPTPRIRVSNTRPVNTARSKSNIWSFFKVGLLRTPEIELQDLKLRGINKIGSRNSTSTNGSVHGISFDNDKDNENGSNDPKKKKQLRFFDRNGALFGGCKCSVNSTVDQTVIQYSRSNNVLRKSKSVNEISTNGTIVEEETMKKRKQAMSRHRTFEWLKELSISGVLVEA